MKKLNVVPWGELFNKKISVVKSILDLEEPTVAIGNQNSYGDVILPYSNFGIEVPDSKNENDGFITSKETIENFIRKTNTLLYGVPGKGNVTIGGAIASDVHGKDNLWGGSFSKNIDQISIILPSNEIITASETVNSDVFFATLGGYGLTGIIRGALLKTNEIKYSGNFITNYITGSGIEDLISSFHSKQNTYWVAWVNLLKKQKDWVIEESRPGEGNQKNVDIANQRPFKLSIPFIGLNRFAAMRIINSIFYHSKKLSREKRNNIFEVLHPLSRWTDTKNISKNRKIIQIQFSIPDKNKHSLDYLLNILINKQTPLLCSVKRLGIKTNESNLSFIQDGWTAAIDFPADSFNHNEIRIFYRKLTELEGKIYLAKDSTLDKDEFMNMYPDYHSWSKIVRKIDPNNIFQSELSKRLGLKPW